MPLTSEERRKVEDLLGTAHTLTISGHFPDDAKGITVKGKFAVPLGPILLVRSLPGDRHQWHEWKLFVLDPGTRVVQRRDVAGGPDRIEIIGPHVLIEHGDEGPWWDRLRAELPRLEQWVEEAEEKESQAKEDEVRNKEVARREELERARSIIEQAEPVSSISVPK